MVVLRNVVDDSWLDSDLLLWLQRKMLPYQINCRMRLWELFYSLTQTQNSRKFDIWGVKIFKRKTKNWSWWKIELKRKKKQINLPWWVDMNFHKRWIALNEKSKIDALWVSWQMIWCHADTLTHMHTHTYTHNFSFFLFSFLSLFSLLFSAFFFSIETFLQILLNAFVGN